ncbi:MAG: DNA-binding domain-containing protein [Pseudomonadota bacterium]
MKPNSLNYLQQHFQDYLFSPAQDDGEPSTSVIHAAISDRFGLPANERLAIYYNAYRIRLRQALEEVFSKTYSYLGDDLFAQMCDGYVQTQPSAFQNLRWYGHQFSGFLAKNLEDHPIVAELAAFEWALSLAFDADDATILCANDVRHLAPEQWESIGFTLHPSVQILSQHCNTTAIWLALDKEQTPPDAINSESASHWLVWRKQLQPQFRSINGFETSALQGLQQGRCFSAVCEAAIESAGEQDITVQMAGWLQTWLNDAVIMEYKL